MTTEHFKKVRVEAAVEVLIFFNLKLFLRRVVIILEIIFFFCMLYLSAVTVFAQR